MRQWTVLELLEWTAGHLSGKGFDEARLTVDLLGADEARPGVRELVQATLDLVRGLGLAATITDDTRRRKRILDQWAHTLDEALA